MVLSAVINFPMLISSVVKLIDKKSQSGQTMIETVVAIFVLVMGVVAALGLAIYTFNSSGNVTKQIIATGLAREGLEAVRSMRDTNWLKLSIDTDCYNFSTGANDAKCYKKWLQPPGSPGNGTKKSNKGFDIKPGGSSDTYIMYVDVDSDNRTWKFSSDNSYGLDLDSGLTGSAGFYNGNGSTHGTSDYYRKITITLDSAAPYNHSSDLGPLVKVKSQVWWTDKRCPRVVDWPGTGKCSVEMEMYLTNWKNF